MIAAPTIPRLLVALLVTVGGPLAATGCSTSLSSAPGTTSAPTTSLIPATTTTTPLATTEATTVRTGDVTDVSVLAATMTTATDGDPAWIPVIAELRAKSWLATRYPGRYDMTEIYADEWAAGNPAALEAELVELDVYFDEALPILVSVVPTRTRGELVELEVLLEATEARIRQNADDAVIGSRPGGPARGLFVVGPTGPGRSWRIHSVVELDLPDEVASPSDEAGSGGSSP